MEEKSGKTLGEWMDECESRIRNLEDLVAILAETKYTVIQRRSHQRSAHIEYLMKKIRRLP